VIGPSLLEKKKLNSGRSRAHWGTWGPHVPVLRQKWGPDEHLSLIVTLKNL